MKCELPVEEFYDLQNDPFEMRNLAADPAASATLKPDTRRAEAQARGDGIPAVVEGVAMNPRQARDHRPPVFFVD